MNININECQQLKGITKINLMILSLLILILRSNETCYNSHGMSTAEKQKIIDDLNKFRNQVANGSQAGQPGATNMNQMSWDMDLENLAQDYLDTCPGNVPNPAPNTTSYFNCGESYFMGPAGNNSISGLNTYNPIEIWFGEVANFSNSSISPFVASSSAVHYSQVEWAKTDRIGCGMNYDGLNWYILCNWYPGNNKAGDVMYIAGK